MVKRNKRTQQNDRQNYVGANAKLVMAIVPIVLLMIVIFFVLTRNEILTLSKDRLALESKNYAKDISTWAEQVLKELDIYKAIVEEMGLDDEKTYAMLRTSSGTHDEYPFGVYLGDDAENYFDSSGWIPEEDYVVTEREWYREGLMHDRFTFGEPYMDAMTGDICVSATTRIANASSVCVMAADVYLDYALGLVAEIAEGEIEKAFFVTHKSRIIVADSDPQQIGQALTEAETPLLYRNINKLLNQGEMGQIGQSLVKGDGGVYYVDINKIENTDWYFVTCMKKSDMLKHLRHVQLIMLAVAVVAAGILIIVTFRVSREMGKIGKKAKSDPLTKLLNRDGFKEMTLLALETNPNQGLLMILDMDNFKLINDQLGHPEGDVVLTRFAQLLEDYFNRNKDIVARIGGDEFAVFIGRVVTNGEAESMLKKFLHLFHECFDDAYPAQKLSVSIGAAFVLGSGSYEQLYQNADEMLYEVKNKGKNSFRIRK